MKKRLGEFKILMADDDTDDRLLMKEAFEETSVPSTIDFVEDGVELMDYLYKRGRFAEEKITKPSLILLDLNMPKMNGHEALRHIKSDPDLRRIPILVLTTSKSELDISRTYDLGVNSYISKPVQFNEMLKVATEIGRYWFDTVELPKD